MISVQLRESVATALSAHAVAQGMTVEEYLENLGTEYRFGCYHEKNPKGNICFCHCVYVF